MSAATLPPGKLPPLPWSELPRRMPARSQGRSAPIGTWVLLTDDGALPRPFNSEAGARAAAGDPALGCKEAVIARIGWAELAVFAHAGPTALRLAVTRRPLRIACPGNHDAPPGQPCRTDGSVCSTRAAAVGLLMHKRKSRRP